ncbi:MAG TPA: hypothetical protein P5250_06085 [Bacteroidales bacterium]|nr:hypothetical protein [Bacteroidales bacterium]
MIRTILILFIFILCNCSNIKKEKSNTIIIDTTSNLIKTTSSKKNQLNDKYIARTFQFFTGEFSKAKAMKLLYGHYDTIKNFSIWKISNEKDQPFITKISAKNSIYTSIAFIHEFVVDTIPVVVLITETSHRDNKGYPDDCHACAPIMGAAIFAKIKNTWCLQNFEKNLGEYGYWGRLPKISFIKYGQNNYGILFEVDDYNNGINSGKFDILGVVNDKFSFIGSFPMSFSNEHSWISNIKYSYQSEFNFIPEPTKDYYDVSIKTYGTKPYEDKYNYNKKKTKIALFKENKIYSFDDSCSCYILKASSLYESFDTSKKNILSIK